MVQEPSKQQTSGGSKIIATVGGLITLLIAVWGFFFQSCKERKNSDQQEAWRNADKSEAARKEWLAKEVEEFKKEQAILADEANRAAAAVEQKKAEDASFVTIFHDNHFKGGGKTFGFNDKPVEDFDSIKFDDAASAVQWEVAPNWQGVLYWDNTFDQTNKRLTLRGKGESVDLKREFGFGDEASSFRFERIDPHDNPGKNAFVR